MSIDWKIHWYPFSQYPISDSCWSLSVGPDGRIYAAACCERTGGETVKLVRYNEDTDSLDFLFDFDEMVDDPRGSGRATQSKIHYSFAPSMKDGILYMATHLSGPGFGKTAYSPWHSWHDTSECFRGSAVLAFNTRTDTVEWWDTLIPKEGCRCLLHDEDRGRLYAISYPRDHMIVYDLETRTRRDLGRIGSVNAQALFLDAKHRVWTTSDYGHLVRYDPDSDRLEWSPETLPHDVASQTGWHCVLYDAVAAPDAPCIYAVSWVSSPRLMRIWPDDGEWGRVEDLGPVTQARDTARSVTLSNDHCGGLTFAGDGCLYYAASAWYDPDHNQMPEAFGERAGFIWRYDPDSDEREVVARLERPDEDSQYVSRGAVDHNGDLFFAHCIGKAPVGIFKVDVPAERKRKDAHLPIRMWG